MFSFLNVTMFTDYANAEDEEGEAIEFVEPAAEPGDEVQPRGRGRRAREGDGVSDGGLGERGRPR